MAEAPNFPRVRLVDSPKAGANVLHDLHDDDGLGARTSVIETNWSFGELDLLGDADAIGVEWALRTITFTQEIAVAKVVGATEDESRATNKPKALAALQRHTKALLRRRSWLEFQLSPELSPVWWHAYRTPPGVLSLEEVYADDRADDDVWSVSGNLEVDPFSYGSRVTHPTKVIGNDPAGTAPASGYTLPTIRGDAPTRLRVKITPSTMERMPSRWLVACVASARSAPVLDSPLGAGDNLEPANQTVNDSGSIGGSYRLINFVNNGGANLMAPRFSGAFPATGALPGQYQVLMRVSTSELLATTVALRIHSTAGTPLTPVSIVSFPQVSSMARRTWQWVSLGVLGINDALPDDVNPGLARRALSIWMSTTSVNANAAQVDHMKFIPVSGRDIASASCQVVESTGAPGAVGPSSTVPLLIDGDDEVKWLPGAQEGDYILTDAGGFPEVDPAAAFNHLLVMAMQAETQTDNGGASQLAATAQVETSYHPRSAWLGDGINPVTDVVNQIV